MSLVKEADLIENYILAHTSAESALRQKIERAANIQLVRPRMLSGHLQGNLIQMICKLAKVKYALEIGTYSGYAAHCIAEALPKGGEVHTLECDDEMEDFIRTYINEAEYSEKIKLHIGTALELMPSLLEQYQFDLVYMDANKREYVDYYKILMKYLPSGSLILADNTLWDGKVVQEVKPNDIQTQQIIKFNKLVAEDERVENLILPLRDGLSLIRVL